ncbi:programmed cell death protein [Cladochytrium tenue]|nr:programmed cell death protein [Cladochytrium tenue]
MARWLVLRAVVATAGTETTTAARVVAAPPPSVPPPPPTPQTPSRAAAARTAVQLPAFGSFGTFGESPADGDRSVGGADEIAAMIAARDRQAYGVGDDDNDEDAADERAPPPTAVPGRSRSGKKKNKSKKKDTPGASAVAASAAVSAFSPAAADKAAPESPAVDATADSAAAAAAPTAVVADAPPPLTWADLPRFPPVALEYGPESAWRDDHYDYERRLLEQYARSERVAVPDSRAAVSTSSAASAAGEWSGEAYEKVRPKHYDKVFKTFQRTVEMEPAQCVRYGIGTRPVFFASDDVLRTLSTTGPPPCQRCGGQRAFELQLMPAVLSLLPTEEEARRRLLLRRRDESSRLAPNATVSAAHPADGTAASQRLPASPPTLTTMEQPAPTPRGPAIAVAASARLDALALGMDFGTVLVYVCERDCTPPPLRPASSSISYSEEYAVPQTERWRSS